MKIARPPRLGRIVLALAVLAALSSAPTVGYDSNAEAPKNDGMAKQTADAAGKYYGGADSGGDIPLTAEPTPAKNYLDESRTIANAPQSTTERFIFTLGKDSRSPHIELVIQMTQGRADVHIVGPGGRKVQDIGAQRCTVKQPLIGATSTGNYTVELTTSEAVGYWRLRIYEGPVPRKRPLGLGLAAAGFMMLVAVASVWFWRRRTGVAWRWFCVGAAVWAVAVAAKFAIAIPLNGPVFKGLKGLLPYWSWLTVGTVYGGALTGVTEVLFTLIAALIWRRMAATAARGVAVGVGAGAFEAALLAIVSAVGRIAAGASGVTWGILLAPATERLIAILCHTATRALVLLAVARRRWKLFW
jgi:uncharacterized membrane protein YhfC